jgi:hypothetical protein
MLPTFVSCNSKKALNAECSLKETPNCLIYSLIPKQTRTILKCDLVISDEYALVMKFGISNGD